MSMSDYRKESPYHLSRRKGEGFLYLYLSIMLAIFAVVFVIDVQGKKAMKSSVSTSPISDEFNYNPNRAANAHVLVDRTIDLFRDEQSAFNLGGVDALRFLLRSHDVHARVLITGSLKDPELAYARALLLQAELENSSLYHNDVRIELDFSSNESGLVFVTLYAGVSTETELL